jgi:hypothetical protein
MSDATTTSSTTFTTSADGTEIAYDVTGPRSGTGRPVVVVEVRCASGRWGHLRR